MIGPGRGPAPPGLIWEFTGASRISLRHISLTSPSKARIKRFTHPSRICCQLMKTATGIPGKTFVFLNAETACIFIYFFASRWRQLCALRSFPRPPPSKRHCIMQSLFCVSPDVIRSKNVKDTVCLCGRRARLNTLVFAFLQVSLSLRRKNDTVLFKDCICEVNTRSRNFHTPGLAL